MQETWRYQSDGSVYAAEKVSNGVFAVGGSTWQRRILPFSETARHAEGIVKSIALEDGLPIEIKMLTLPSMVNVLISVKGNIFACCKSHRHTFNILDSNLRVTRSRDDLEGGGVYNSIYHNQKDTVISVTRNGGLLAINPESLDIEKRVQLAQTGIRVWSIACWESRGMIFAGDYDGNLYALDQDLRLVDSLNLTAYLDPALPPHQKKYNPSVFGLSVDHKGILAASIRWGQVFRFATDNSRLQFVDSFVVGQEISQLAYPPFTNELLIGTRSGTLLSQRDPVISIPPALQNDNSIWSISFHGRDEVLICFADGQVVNTRV